ncbi:unnamed protein product, partial [Symbiodinium pilosum]
VPFAPPMAEQEAEQTAWASAMTTISSYLSGAAPTASAQVISKTMCETDVQKAQAAWASAIKKISKTYLDG